MPRRVYDREPPTTRAFCIVQGVAPHRARRTARRRCRRWRRATCCRWRSCRARPTATPCCSSTPTGRRRPQARRRDAGRGRRRRVASATCAAALGGVRGPGAARTSTCAGPSGATTARKLIFAARPGAASGLDLWLLDVGGRAPAGSSRTDNGRAVNGVRVHNFDPVFAPDGSVVFASTRVGDAARSRTSCRTRTSSASAPGVRLREPEQMTFLLNSRARAGLHAGRARQLHGREGDAGLLPAVRPPHELGPHRLPPAARAARAVDRHVHDRRCTRRSATSRPRRSARGSTATSCSSCRTPARRAAGGALATFNRSIGPFEADRTEVTLPEVAGRSSTRRRPDARARRASTARRSRCPTARSWRRTPRTSPTRRRRRPSTTWSPSTADGRAARAGQRPALSLRRGGAGLQARRARAVPPTCRSWCSAATASEPTSARTASMHFPDLPLLATLLGANLRRGRNVAAFDSATRAAGLSRSSRRPARPPAAACSSQMVYTEPHVARLGAASRPTTR